MKSPDLLKFVIGIMGAAAGTVSFTYSTFTTKEYVKDAIVERLDRIEQKLDRLTDRDNHPERR